MIGRPVPTTVPPVRIPAVRKRGLLTSAGFPNWNR